MLLPVSRAAEFYTWPSSSVPDPLPVEWVVRQALENYPGVKAARAHWEAMKNRVAQARAWEDPMVGVDVERAGTRFDRYMATEWMIAQSVPLSGKNRQHARAVLAEASRALAELRRRELDVTARARLAFIRAAYARTQLKLNLDQQETLKDFMEKSREKHQSGPRLQADLLTAQTELATLTEHQLDFQRGFSDQQSQLNILMNRPPHAELPLPEPLRYKPLSISPLGIQPLAHGPEEVQVVFDWAMFQRRMQSMALAHRPELFNAEHQIQAAQARHSLAKRQWIPDPVLRFEARQFQGGPRGIREYDTGIFFNFPWINRSKYKAAIQEAKEDLNESQREIETLQLETLALVRDLVRKLETVEQHYQFFRDQIIPLSSRALEAVQLNYSSDAANFWELLMTHRAFRQSELMMHKHLAEYWETLADLEAAAGVNLDHLTAEGGNR